jgi:membrane protein YqaA with SNARE-associated domain
MVYYVLVTLVAWYWKWPLGASMTAGWFGFEVGKFVAAGRIGRTLRQVIRQTVETDPAAALLEDSGLCSEDQR